jgi:cyanophycin synthetase
MPGDRRNDDHNEYARLAGHTFDTVIIREDKDLRGRSPGESADLLLAGLQQAQKEGGRVQDVEVITDEQAALLAGMSQAGPGDLVVLCADDITGVYRRVMAEANSRSSGAAIGAPGEFEVEEG